MATVRFLSPPGSEQGRREFQALILGRHLSNFECLVSFSGSQGSPGMSQDSPGTSQDCPGTFQFCPATSQDSPGAFQDSPGTSQACAGRSQDCPATLQDYPATCQDSPGMSQDCPGTSSQNCSGTSQDSLGTFQDCPGTFQNCPGMPQDSSATSQDCEGFCGFPELLGEPGPRQSLVRENTKTNESASKSTKTWFCLILVNLGSFLIENLSNLVFASCFQGSTHQTKQELRRDQSTTPAHYGPHTRRRRRDQSATPTHDTFPLCQTKRSLLCFALRCLALLCSALR